MSWKHPHPINILENTTKYFYLLLLPLLRGLFAFQGGFYAWLGGVWFDLLILSTILLIAFLRWRTTRYCYSPEGLHLQTDFLIQKRCFLAFDRLASVRAEYPFYFKPFGAVRLRADTDGGGPRRADLSITLHQREAEAVFDKLRCMTERPDAIRKIYRPRWFALPLLSWITSSTLSGVLFFSALISQSGNLLGQEFETQLVGGLTRLGRALAFGLPPFAALIGWSILGGWLISFGINVVRHVRFSANRKNDRLEIRAGIFTRRFYSIAVRRICLLQLRQGLLTKLLGYDTVFIRCAGYGKAKNEHPVLIPAAERSQTLRNLGILLPEIPLVAKHCLPPLRTLPRFFLPPAGCILGLVAVFHLGSVCFPEAEAFLSFLGLMAQIPAFWWLLVKMFSFWHTGFGCKNGICTFYFCRGLRFFTVSLPAEKIVALSRRQSVFQRFSRSCDLIVDCYGEGKTRLVIPSLPLQEVMKIFDLT